MKVLRSNRWAVLQFVVLLFVMNKATAQSATGSTSLYYSAGTSGYGQLSGNVTTLSTGSEGPTGLYVEWSTCYPAYPYRCLGYFFTGVGVYYELKDPSQTIVAYNGTYSEWYGTYAYIEISPYTATSNGTWTADGYHGTTWGVYEVICEQYFDPESCIPFEYLDYYELWDWDSDAGVNVPPPCTDPSYSPPPLVGVPGFSYQSSGFLAQWGTGTRGRTEIAFGGSVYCRQLCSGEYRLEGDLNFSAFDIYIADDVPAGDMCLLNPNRNSTFIQHTQQHELVHANAYRDVVIPFRLSLGQVYPTQNACMTVVGATTTNAPAALSNTLSTHEQHVNTHTGEEKYQPYCPAPAQPPSTFREEAFCTSGLVQCSQDTY